MDALDKSFRLPFLKRSTTLRHALVHGAYWVLITGFFIYEKRYLIYKASMPYFVACVAGRIVLLIIIAYFNLQYFLPRYLLKKRYAAYFTAIILSVIGYLAAQSLFDFYLYGYVVGPMRNSNLVESLSYNFFSTLWYLGLMLALKLSMDWYSQQLIIQKITVEKLNAEVNFLRAQVNPHFLFNVLNNLYALTLKKSELAPDVVLKLSEMMEYMLYDSTGERVPLEKEVGYLHSYMELERLRFGGEADIDLNIDAEINGHEIAPLLLIPLVENAFKHGLARQTKSSWLRVDIGLKQSTLEVIIENAKPSSVINNGKGGIGLDNLRKRLDLLYPNKHELWLEDRENSFWVKLVIGL
ncbi:Histidine kinase [Mucilaginibacter gossypiicola]|uniref:Histidine kinase n=1 Tax=Mucilaginibacter gossypiicola TaxID=551995 RepID=A0A1H8MSX0_9SPHI|nr:histidine kinase [Mucilaginibacter gossypiicola]SEO20515.1 Histidine kinase [Mucilaginibacter gossypiicola]